MAVWDVKIFIGGNLSYVIEILYYVRYDVM